MSKFRKIHLEQCPVIYDGESYPEFHGTRCSYPTHPHENADFGGRHRGLPTGEKHSIIWLTSEEKKARHAK